LLQLVRPRDYHTYTNGAKVEEKSEIVEIAVVKRIFVVPFDLKRDAILVAIDLVRWTVDPLTIDFDCGPKLLFNPPAAAEEAVDCRR
jgi:hypothetical protein